MTATVAFGMGITMIGPTILDYGTEAQKELHIPPIVRGDVRWCVGYSEPGAGSDLASLQTKCEDKGEHWLINGSKILTSGAQHSDWCGCLVRTDPTVKKHDGISFILLDMHQPGVETRPIALIAGASPFCETFFTDVRVPKENLVGPLNGGWTIAKRLLQHERNGIGSGQATAWTMSTAPGTGSAATSSRLVWAMIGSIQARARGMNARWTSLRYRVCLGGSLSPRAGWYGKPWARMRSISPAISAGGSVRRAEVTELAYVAGSCSTSRIRAYVVTM